MTTQIDERIILDGEKAWLASSPSIPKKHPRIAEVRLEEMVVTEDQEITLSTACWRRYVGTWEITGGHLYLADVIGRYKIVGEGPILADWFSGVLRIPRGEVLEYRHIGIPPVYEEVLCVKIRKGVVVSSRVIDNGRKKLFREWLRAG
jgi:hypothetical protein